MENDMPEVPPTNLPIPPTPRPSLSLRPLYMTLLVIFGILVGTGGLIAYQTFFRPPPVTSYEECVKANGSQQLLLYPGVCVTSDGKRFTQPLTEEEKQNIMPPDETATWTLHTITPEATSSFVSYTLKLPASWRRIEHSSNFQNSETFEDAAQGYRLTFEQQKNYNDQTGKPYASLRALTGLAYDVPTMTVDSLTAARVLPRAGSEHINKVVMFSKDEKLVFAITLETPRDGSKITEGETLFTQILSTVTFITPPVPTQTLIKVNILDTSAWTPYQCGGIAFKIPTDTYTYVCPDYSEGSKDVLISKKGAMTTSVTIQIRPYDGGSRRQYWISSLHASTDEVSRYMRFQDSIFGKVAGLDVFGSGGWWQGGYASPILIAQGKTIVLIHGGRDFDDQTGKITRWDFSDSIASTIQFL